MKVEVITPRINKWFNTGFYLLMTTLGALMLILFKDLTWAGINLNLALIFDPFDQSVPFSKRPFYQKTLLITQLALGCILLVVGFFFK
ncbi:hypothetical protein GCM10027429_01150 [Marivirga atlantica]|jgi:hypothetical protein|uniref:Uncharacterized protein n=1 Tax=Marivirga atlantica TaxID=1548457 RepID=A0A937DD10_9BACT|nr:hypothetical protein [Marivirga atlantica]MBL0763727.1 hypothetical protein [Marivirga atlantica]